MWLSEKGASWVMSGDGEVDKAMQRPQRGHGLLFMSIEVGGCHAERPTSIPPLSLRCDHQVLLGTCPCFVPSYPHPCNVRLRPRPADCTVDKEGWEHMGG